MMINKKQFRETASRSEIKQLIKKSSKSKDNIIWQTRPEGRDVLPVKMMVIGLETRTMRIYGNFNECPKLTEAFPIYVKLNEGSTIFKGQILSLKKSEVIISLPEKVTTEENRTIPRIAFPLNENFHLTISVPSVLVKYASLQLKVSLRDIAKKGCGITLSDGQTSNLHIGTDIVLEKLGEEQLEQKIKGKIVYIMGNKSKIQEQLGYSFRGGIQLQEDIPQKYLDLLIEQTKKELT